jgi:hypothetical protein
MAEQVGRTRRASRRGAIAALLLPLAAVKPASAGADGLSSIAVPVVAESPRGGSGEVPPACRAYAVGAAADLTTGWDQLLSFAGCVQDASVEPIVDLAQLPAAVGRRYDALAPAIMLYLEAIEHGPTSVQLRAAYAVGLANVALITRLRSSLVAPNDLSDAAAVVRYQALKAELEPLLLRAQRTAWIAFTVVDRAAAQDPAIASDPVSRSAVAAARAMLRVLNDAARDRARPVPSGVGIFAT